MSPTEGPNVPATPVAVNPDAVTPAMPSAMERGLRTLVAGGVVYLAAWISHLLGVKVSSSDEAYVVAGVMVVGTAAYNAVALWAEKRWSWARWLLLRIGN